MSDIVKLIMDAALYRHLIAKIGFSRRIQNNRELAEIKKRMKRFKSKVTQQERNRLYEFVKEYRRSQNI